MVRVETEEFIRFRDFHFNREEMEAYRVLVLRLLALDKPRGHFEGYIHKDEVKKYHLHFYRSRKGLYTLVAHLERKGEPPKAFSKTLENYLGFLRESGE